MGVPFEIHQCASTDSVRTAQGMVIGALEPLPTVSSADWVFVPGFPLDTPAPIGRLVRWLREASENGARLYSVCTGAFALGGGGFVGWAAVHHSLEAHDRASSTLPSRQGDR
jgi:transcriptional regulator GlxA family with amidase domain